MGGGDELKEATEKDKYAGQEIDVGAFIRKLFMHCLGKKVQEKLANGDEIRKKKRTRFGFHHREDLLCIPDGKIRM